MSKITFRADDDLVERVEDDDASKSEVMREALRLYLDTEREATDAESGDAAAASDGDTGEADDTLTEIVDELVTERLRSFVGDRVDAHLTGAVGDRGRPVETTRRGQRPPARSRGPARETPSVVVNVAGESSDDAVSYDDRAATDRTATDRAADDRRPSNESRASDDGRAERPPEAVDAHDDDGRDCARCGTDLSSDHVYCPNCGEKAARRLFCDCGDEVRSDWSFCPGCGRRTPAADVLDEGADERGQPRR